MKWNLFMCRTSILSTASLNAYCKAKIWKLWEYALLAIRYNFLKVNSKVKKCCILCEPFFTLPFFSLCSICKHRTCNITWNLQVTSSFYD